MYILLIICFLELPLTIFYGFLIIPIVILDNYPQYYKTEPYYLTYGCQSLLIHLSSGNGSKAGLTGFYIRTNLSFILHTTPI